MSGLADKKLNGASNIGSDIDDFFNDLIDFFITGFNILAGVVTFTNHPVTPSSAPTTDYQVANKKYVDDEIGEIPAQVGFGSWASKNANTVYQADTDGFVMAYIADTYDNATSYVKILTDSSNPPTTVRAWEGTSSGTTALRQHVISPVKKGDYYKVEAQHGGFGSGSWTVYWLPLGS